MGCGSVPMTSNYIALNGNSVFWDIPSHHIWGLQGNLWISKRKKYASFLSSVPQVVLRKPPLLGILYPKDYKWEHKEIIIYPCSWRYSQQPKAGNSSNVHHQMNGQKYQIRTMDYEAAFERKEMLTHASNTEGQETSGEINRSKRTKTGFRLYKLPRLLA